MPSDTETFYISLFGWIVLWCVVLHIKEGARALNSTLRLNFWHGTISSYLILHTFWKGNEDKDGKFPELFLISNSLAYYIVDLNNLVLNDFVYKISGSTQHGKNARIMEYFHHILSIVATLACATQYSDICDLSSPSLQFQGPQNPLLYFTLADISTPFLVLWRRSEQKSLLWYSIFAILFFAVRVVYHGFYFVPALFNGCNNSVKAGLVLYQGMQIVMMVFVLNRWYKMVFGKVDEGVKAEPENENEKDTVGGRGAAQVRLERVDMDRKEGTKEVKKVTEGKEGKKTN